MADITNQTLSTWVGGIVQQPRNMTCKLLASLSQLNPDLHHVIAHSCSSIVRARKTQTLPSLPHYAHRKPFPFCAAEGCSRALSRRTDIYIGRFATVNRTAAACICWSRSQRQSARGLVLLWRSGFHNLFNANQPTPRWEEEPRQTHIGRRARLGSRCNRVTRKICTLLLHQAP